MGYSALVDVDKFYASWLKQKEEGGNTFASVKLSEKSLQVKGRVKSIFTSIRYKQNKSQSASN